MLYRLPRGTQDILPEEQPYWSYIIKTAERMASLYGYRRIDTPVFEETGLFTRGVGQGTDIVEKEMYIFEDRGGDSLTLRPEGTAPVCRAYLEHGMQNVTQPVRLYYITPIFRYERPQSGRYRQHHQFGYEALGDASPVIDSEVVNIAWDFYKTLKLTNLKLVINSIGCRHCRPEYINNLKEYYSANGDRICPDCQVRLVKNPLRLLDCKNESCQMLTSSAPRSADYLCQDCREHFRSLLKYLDALKLPYLIDHRLVRGLDYYTRTVFEVQPLEGGAQSTIGGGGRYDDLIEQIGGKATPGIGFATGLERIIAHLKKEQIDIGNIPEVEVYIASIGENTIIRALEIAAELRTAGISTIISSGIKGLKRQLKQANTLGISKVIIIGETELASGSAIIRDMVTSQQQTLPLEEIMSLLKS